MSATNLTVNGLSKRYGDFVALAPTDLDVAQGEFLTLLGPSGSGKTTLLSLIAGLSHPDSGSIHINGTDVTYGAPYERDIGMVFQNYALFPHMTVGENIAFPLQMRKVDAAATRKRVAEALEMVHLPHLAGRYPRELSGGQQQRIALARCMVYRPSIILMDEPLGALDKKLRDHMQLEIKRIHRDLGTTIVYVTHDQEEAMTMSDRICLMNAGAIAQLGTPADLYFRPKSVFVADFLGESNLLDATVSSRDDERVGIAIGGRHCGHAMAYDGSLRPGSKARIMIRPQNLHVEAGNIGADQPNQAESMQARLTDIMVTGGMTKLYLQAIEPVNGGTEVIAAFPTNRLGEQYEIGQALRLRWSASDAVAIAE
ncbi:MULTISPECIES: ABC transporter ATP-binding protein [Burkholderia]|uniref:Spermidine/putrescine import ATP-binding protein PotA n=1 Tax=Burkholderia cenocepacia TaxID=95486 RepID=A0A071M8S8_9BURK|nr:MULTISPECIES: ABC transporter ATP-binding protein [Burkholderia]MBJ9592211.1 ABC transporter ATP-binding protein [Burkholderia seminalis]MBN3739669.1 ABC transporter ATP-binding protein [Burkholderia sp. Tr-20355]MCA8305399.1 ABC transporter ATP-binding protein [Burkholderia seminalis]MCA8426194.1 ABC transporter ATP-binding protein [Burkholderia seminalis]MCA8430565.1 ABC transporter ATP-binding protein [Burkholderia seminalis]